MNIKALLALLIAFCRKNPAAVSIGVSELALGLAHMGFHVSTNTLYQIGALLVPVLLAYFHVAKESQKRAAVEAAKAEAGKN